MMEVILMGLQIIGIVLTVLALVVYLATVFGEKLVKCRMDMDDEVKDTVGSMRELMNIGFDKKLRLPFAVIKFIGMWIPIILISYILFGPYLLGIRTRVWFFEIGIKTNKTIKKILYKDGNNG